MATARKPVPGVPSSSRSKRGAGFAKASGGSAVRIGRDGGQNTGMPTVCSSKRAAPNVRSY